MHLRTNNRSGVHSLDRTRGGATRSRGNYLPNTSSNRRDTRLNYNSSSIPYLNKRQGVVDSALAHQNKGVVSGAAQGQNILSSYDMAGKRPAGYDPVRLNNNNGMLPSVRH